SRPATAVPARQLARSVHRRFSAGLGVIVTTRQVIRLAVTEYELLDSSEAQILYDQMRAEGYTGPSSLWGE
ncbi:MAG: hypothetical protein LC808_04715, partial [Actinobacteria bacterium]|nr:hypothetical protein [Actinomycetota bacterium]